MARTSTYLNFSRNTQAAFEFYRSVFGGDYTGNGVMRFRDIPHSRQAKEIGSLE